MFIKINRLCFNENYSSDSISVAGVGVLGQEAVSSQKISAEDISFVDSVTMFSYDINKICEEKEIECQKVCRNSLALFVIADFENESSIHSACILSDYYHVNEESTNKSLCFCITLEKYKGTEYDKQLHTCFDKVIYVEKPSMLFAPVEVLFLHPTGIVGIDYADVFHIIRGNSLYLVQKQDIRDSSLISKLSEAVKEKMKSYNIEKVGAFGNLLFEENASIDSMDNLNETIKSIVSKYDSDAQALCNWIFHKDNKTKASIILCDIGEIE